MDQINGLSILLGTLKENVSSPGCEVSCFKNFSVSCKPKIILTKYLPNRNTNSECCEALLGRFVVKHIKTGDIHLSFRTEKVELGMSVLYINIYSLFFYFFILVNHTLFL